MTRNRVIQHLINQYKLKRYLEIGVEYRQTFDSILCKYKIGLEPYINTDVLPITSDEFFSQNKELFDIIFIDGLHLKEQAIRDIQNSLNVLLPGGFIVVHDCNPIDEIMQKVPREQLIWTGDVWKAFIHFRRNPDLMMFVVDTDFGCGVITQGKQDSLILSDNEITYKNLSTRRREWLNLISLYEFQHFLQTKNFPESVHHYSSAVSVGSHKGMY